VGGVRGRHDEFALRSVEMAAPVGHDAVGAHGFRVVLVPAFATVAHDRVIRDAGRETLLNIPVFRPLHAWRDENPTEGLTTMRDSAKSLQRSQNVERVGRFAQHDNPSLTAIHHILFTVRILQSNCCDKHNRIRNQIRNRNKDNDDVGRRISIWLGRPKG
jgi:hypothetical protein